MKWYLFLALLALGSALSNNDEFEEDLEERALVEKSAFRPQKHFTADVEGIDEDAAVIASLREIPSEVHLCSASFIRRDALITTARCIYGKRPVHTYVHSMSVKQYGSGVAVAVKAFKPHPNFEVSPPINNIGLIFTKQKMPKAHVLGLPQPWQYHLGSVITYQWKFGKNNVDFYLHRLMTSLISNAKCSIILKEFVDCKYVCIGNAVIHMGSMDQGVPMSGMHNRSAYILGIYNRDGTDRSVNAEKFEKIYPHTEWIKHNLGKISEASSYAMNSSIYEFSEAKR